MSVQRKFQFAAQVVAFTLVAAATLPAQTIVSALGVDSAAGSTPGTSGVTAGTTKTVFIAVTATPVGINPALRWTPTSGSPTTLQYTSSINGVFRFQVPASLITSADPGVVVQLVLPSQATSGPFPFPVNPPVSIPPELPNGTMPNGAVGSSYTAQRMTVGGTAPFTPSLQAGFYPPGLVATVGAAGVSLSGTPTQPGTFYYTLTTTDAWGSSISRQYGLTVNGATLVVTDPTVLPNGGVGVPYAQPLTASGGQAPYVYSLFSGSLPPGLTLASNGTVSGTPTGAGTYTFRVYVRDSRPPASGTGTAQFNVTITINPPQITITTASPLTPALVNAPYSAGFLATGGVGSYVYTLDSGSLPPGLTLQNSGVLSGTPTKLGSYTFTIRAADSQQQFALKSFLLAVNPPAMTITTTSLPAGFTGTAYSATLAATGGTPPYHWSATGLPAGLTLDPSSGALTGTPTAAGSYAVNVFIVDNADVSATRQFSLTVTVPVLAITTASPLPDAAAGVAYSQTLAASGGVAPFTFAVVKGALPAGLSLAAGGSLSGTPTAPGTFGFTVQVTDARTNTATKDFSVKVTPAALAITTATLPGGIVGATYSQTVAASGGVQPYTWSGTFPAGLTIDSTGAIKGAPLTPGAATIAVIVTDSTGIAARKSFDVTFTAPALPSVVFGGVSDTSPPLQQPSLQLSLSSPYPALLTGTVTLTFRPDSGGDDGAVVFMTGGRTVNFAIAANGTGAFFFKPNDTNPMASLALQTGTVAGVITLTARFQAGATDVTPSPAPSRQITIAAAAPVIAASPSITATRNATGFTVQLTGYATSREVTQAVFRFTAASGANLGTTDLTVAVTSLFSAWFQDANSSRTGSQFLYTQPFTVNGSSSAIASVTVTLVNSRGSSQTATATLQ